MASSEANTQLLPAKEVWHRLQRGEAVCVTTIPRKKRIYVLRIETSSPPLVIEWKKQHFVIPTYLVGATFCLERTWLYEVAQRQQGIHNVCYRFTDKESRISGEWLSSPSGALGDAYFKVSGKEMKASHNGRAEVGVFSSALLAINVAACRDQLEKINPSLLVHENEIVRFHLDAEQSFMEDPLVSSKSTNQTTKVDENPTRNYNVKSAKRDGERFSKPTVNGKRITKNKQPAERQVAVDVKEMFNHESCEKEFTMQFFKERKRLQTAAKSIIVQNLLDPGIFDLTVDDSFL